MPEKRLILETILVSNAKAAVGKNKRTKIYIMFNLYYINKNKCFN